MSQARIHPMPGDRSRRTAVWLAVLGTLGVGTPLAAASEAAAPATATTARSGVLQEAEELMSRARTEFNGPQPGLSLGALEKAVDLMDRARREGVREDRLRDLLVEASEMKGRVEFNMGSPEKAAESFRSLIRLRPQHLLDKQTVSPKIVEHFNSIKRTMVGRLAVDSRPPGATVSIDGEFLSRTNFFPLEVLAGPHSLEIVRPGYRPEQRSLSIAPGDTEVLEIDLVRTAGSYFLITEPAEVEVWVGGELRATTSGSLAPDQFERAQARGLDPTRSSGRTELANLPIGTHQVELRKKCYDTVRLTLEVREPLDYEAEPLRMTPATGSLRLSSTPPGASISLDGEPAGVTPQQLAGVCAGPHRLEVRHGTGRFVADITVPKGGTLELDCPSRPSLAFLGVVTDRPAGEGRRAEVEARLLAGLAGLRSLNVVPAPVEAIERVLAAEGATLGALVNLTSDGQAARRQLGQRLAAALECDGLLLASLPEESLQRTAIVYLYAAGSAVPDVRPIAIIDDAAISGFAASLDRGIATRRPWSGLITVDTTLHTGVPVLRVIDGSPAAVAGVKVGEILLGADGKPIATTADLLRIVEARSPGDRLSLELRDGPFKRTVELSVGETAVEVSPHDPGTLYNRAIVDMGHRIAGHPGSEQAAVARLNLALSAMYLGDYPAAHEQLLKARDELPSRAGISRGTALHYLGRCLEKLGLPTDAAQAYLAATRIPGATVLSNDGPLVSTLAAPPPAP